MFSSHVLSFVTEASFVAELKHPEVHEVGRRSQVSYQQCLQLFTKSELVRYLDSFNIILRSSLIEDLHALCKKTIIQSRRCCN